MESLEGIEISDQSTSSGTEFSEEKEDEVEATLSHRSRVRTRARTVAEPTEHTAIEENVRNSPGMSPVVNLSRDSSMFHAVTPESAASLSPVSPFRSAQTRGSRNFTVSSRSARKTPKKWKRLPKLNEYTFTSHDDFLDQNFNKNCERHFKFVHSKIKVCIALPV